MRTDITGTSLVISLSICLTAVNDQKNSDLAFLFVNFVNHPPISDPITITPGKRAFQTFDVWVFIWILPQTLEAVVQTFYERRVSALIKMPCIAGEEQIIHPDGCPRSGRSPHFRTAEGLRDSSLRIQPDSAIPGSRRLLLFLRGRPKNHRPRASDRGKAGAGATLRREGWYQLQNCSVSFQRLTFLVNVTVPILPRFITTQLECHSPEGHRDDVSEALP